ncbi:MAG: PadR family transcriptional regulator [Dehalococcoidales bacterium]
MTDRQQSNHRHQLFNTPGGRRPFQRGDFKYIILQYIKDKPSYGYEIIRALQERFHSFYTPSPGSVYPTLQMLEEMGYATAADQEGKKIYTITREGTKFFNKQKEFKERFRDQMRKWWNPDNIDEINELMTEFENLARLVRDQARTADTGKLDRMRKVIAGAHQEISEA